MFVAYDGKSKIGDGPWIEQCRICPLRKGKMEPDKRILKAQYRTFRYRVPVNEINGDW
jgi:hypothetical protein